MHGTWRIERIRQTHSAFFVERKQLYRIDPERDS